MPKRQLVIIIITTLITSGVLLVLFYPKTTTTSNPVTNLINNLPAIKNPLPSLNTITQTLNPANLLEGNASKAFYKATDKAVWPHVATFSTGSTTYAFFIENETGNVYLKPKYGEAVRLSTNLINHIADFQAVLLPSQKVGLFIKQATHARTIYYYGTADLTATTSLSTNFLPVEGNISSLAVSPDNSLIIYAKIINERLFVYRTKPDLSEEKLIWTSPYAKWNLTFTNKNQLLLTSKPEFNQSSISLVLNPLTGQIINRQSAVSGTVFGSRAMPVSIITDTDTTFLKSRITNLTNPKITTTLALPVFTDLCSDSLNPTFIYCATPISSIKTYPTDWYQGKATYNFKIEEINPYNFTSSDLYFPVKSPNFYNLQKVAVSPNGSTLYFVKNNELWQYDLLP